MADSDVRVQHVSRSIHTDQLKYTGTDEQVALTAKPEQLTQVVNGGVTNFSARCILWNLRTDRFDARDLGRSASPLSDARGVRSISSRWRGSPAFSAASGPTARSAPAHEACIRCAFETAVDKWERIRDDVIISAGREFRGHAKTAIVFT